MDEEIGCRIHPAVNAILLLVGVLISFFLYQRELPRFATAVAAITLVLFFLRAWRNLKDPHRREEMERKKQQWLEKSGFIPYHRGVALEAKGTAVVQYLRDTGDRSGENPVLALRLQVRPDVGETFVTEIKRIVPMVLFPQFQPGKEIRIAFNVTEKTGSIDFLSVLTPEGNEIDFRDYPIL